MKQVFLVAILLVYVNTSMAEGIDFSERLRFNSSLLADAQQQVGGYQNYSLTQDEMRYVNSALKWSRWSLVMLGGNAVAMTLVFTLEDPLPWGYSWASHSCWMDYHQWHDGICTSGSAPFV